MRTLALALLSLALATSTAASAPYRLDAGDVVEIWTAQEPSLNRSVVVRPDGGISLPLAGHLQVRGLTLEEFEDAIAEKLKPYYAERLELVAILSPPAEPDLPTLYVAGDVTTPGAYRYRPGMTVLHALSLAGGLLRASSLSEHVQVIESNRDIDLFERRETELAAREMRILAELDGRDRIDVPADMLGGNPALSEAVEEERELFDRRRKRFQEEIAAAQLQLKISREEVEALQSGRLAIDSQIAQVQDGYNKVRALVEKGWASEMRSLELGTRLDELIRNRHELDANLVRTRGAVLQHEETVRTLETQRRLDLTAELAEVQREKEENRIGLQAARQQLSEFGALARLPGGGEPVVVRYSIIREGENGSVEIPAEETTPIQLGDLIRVRQTEGTPTQ